MHRLSHRSSLVAASLLVTALGGSPQAFAQWCEAWVPGPTNNFGVGTDGVVRAMTTWDHDGFPSTPAWLVVGGDFDSAGGVPAKNIAAWDGVSWRALGSGVNNSTNSAQVHALIVYNGELIVGGKFTQAGGVTMDTNVARYSGSTWLNLGSGNLGPSYQSAAYAFAVFNNGTLMIGSENTVGGAAIAVRTWHPLNGWGSAGNFSGTGIVRALEVFNNRLYIGGLFSNIAGVACENLISTNGSTWQPEFVPSIVGVRSLTTNPYDNFLTVAGAFSFVNSIPRNNVAFLGPAGVLPTDPSTESGGMVLATISTFITAQRVIMVGIFNGEYVIRRWDGSQWHEYALDPDGALLDIHMHDPLSSTTVDNMIVAAGDFDDISMLASTTNANNIVQILNDTHVLPLHNAAPIRAMAAYNTGFMVAGDFAHPTLGGVIGRHLVRWDGTNLRTVEPFPNPLNSEGTNGAVHALRTQNVGISTRHLYLGGDFTVAGDVAANRIARYTTSTVNALANFNAMGPGFNNRVTSIEIHNNEVYAAGFFTHSGTTLVNYVARWNASTSTWQSLAGGLNGPVYALKSYNGELYAGGLFSFSAVGAVMPRIARWNGTSWNSVNSLGMTGPGVFELAIHEGSLVAAGDFTGAGGLPANSIAKRNGFAWSAVGPGVTGIVKSLVVSPQNVLMAGGRFDAGPILQNIAHFDGSNWVSAEFNNTFKGPEDRVYALAYRGADLQAGGQFRAVQNYPAYTPIPVPNWARLFDYSQPVISPSRRRLHARAIR